MMQPSTTSDNENSFYVNLLQVLDDNQELFLDVEQFDSIDLCFKVLSDKTLMEDSNLRKTFSLLYSCIKVNAADRPDEPKTNLNSVF